MNVGKNLEKMFSLEDKVVVFTGAAGGIGSAIALGMACAGARIALCDINENLLSDIQNKITEAGGKASSYLLDVTNKAGVTECIDKIGKAYGQIDVLVNCAGINKREGFMDVREETYDRIMDINLKGVFLVTQAVAPFMKNQRKGSIINIGSHNTGSILGGCSVYGATKCGVLSLTRSMAVEWAKYNITVNAIGPGQFPSEMMVFDEATLEYLKQRCPIPRPGQIEELCGQLLLFASEASSYTTGQTIYIDGGWTCV